MALSFQFCLLKHTSLSWAGPPSICSSLHDRHPTALGLLAGTPLSQAQPWWPPLTAEEDCMAPFLCLWHSGQNHRGEADKFSCLLGLELGPFLELHLHMISGPCLGLWNPKDLSLSWVAELGGWVLSWGYHSFVPFWIKPFFKLFISLRTGLGSTITFPDSPFLLKLYLLYFSSPHLLLFTVDLHKSDD